MYRALLFSPYDPDLVRSSLTGPSNETPLVKAPLCDPSRMDTEWTAKKVTVLHRFCQLFSPFCVEGSSKGELIFYIGVVSRSHRPLLLWSMFAMQVLAYRFTC